MEGSKNDTKSAAVGNCKYYLGSQKGAKRGAAIDFEFLVFWGPKMSKVENYGSKKLPKVAL